MSPARIPYLLLLPATLFLLVFFVYPFGLVAIEAFSRDGSFTAQNFQTVFSHWKFPPALTNTLLLALLIVPIQTVLALAMAVLVSKMTRGRDMALYVFTIPLGISDLAAGIIEVE